MKQVDIINGFKITERLEGKGRNRIALAICKLCGNEFKRKIDCLRGIVSCGCLKRNQMKSLPRYMNGFKIIEDLGFEKRLKYRKALVECKVCKKHYEVNVRKLKDRNSCGCARNVVSLIYRKRYPKLIGIYRGIKKRCYQKNCIAYIYYGARGIKMCDEWLNNATSFFEWSIHNGYKEGLTIDKINNDKDYSPNNCRWINQMMQSRNRKSNKLSAELVCFIRKEKKTMSYNELAKKYDTTSQTIYNAVKGRTWKE